MRRIFLILGIVAGFFISCTEDSGDYVRTYYTEAEWQLAARQILNLSLDTALSHLCVTDGFNGNSTYRIGLPPEASAMSDTLKIHEEELLDNLIFTLNRALEKSGESAKVSFTEIIAKTTFPDAAALFKSNVSSITPAFADAKTSELVNALQPVLLTNLKSTGAAGYWNTALSLYRDYNELPLNTDLSGYATLQLVQSLFTEMSIEEMLIRTDSTHRTDALKDILSR
ncbi:MAG: DUF4197 domain-containing protein [Bacteroidales bacterium]|nr:DUF4197 domain-containing protein [Bacteroidales bacterium]